MWQFNWGTFWAVSAGYVAGRTVYSVFKMLVENFLVDGILK
jgi:hypothetical protein